MHVLLNIHGMAGGVTVGIIHQIPPCLKIKICQVKGLSNTLSTKFYIPGNLGNFWPEDSVHWALSGPLTVQKHYQYPLQSKVKMQGHKTAFAGLEGKLPQSIPD